MRHEVYIYIYIDLFYSLTSDLREQWTTLAVHITITQIFVFSNEWNFIQCQPLTDFKLLIRITFVSNHSIKKWGIWEGLGCEFMRADWHDPDTTRSFWWLSYMIWYLSLFAAGMSLRGGGLAWLGRLVYWGCGVCLAGQWAWCTDMLILDSRPLKRCVWHVCGYLGQTWWSPLAIQMISLTGLWSHVSNMLIRVHNSRDLSDKIVDCGHIG